MERLDKWRLAPAKTGLCHEPCAESADLFVARQLPALRGRDAGPARPCRPAGVCPSCNGIVLMPHSYAAPQSPPPIPMFVPSKARAKSANRTSRDDRPGIARCRTRAIASAILGYFTEDGSSPTLWLCRAVAPVVYVLPSVFAIARGHRHAGPITALNIVAGWTFIGYVVALVWSLMPIDGKR
jgi:hypothetical protein